MSDPKIAEKDGPPQPGGSHKLVADLTEIKGMVGELRWELEDNDCRLAALRQSALELAPLVKDVAALASKRTKPKRTRKPSLRTRVKAVVSAGREAVIKPDGTVISTDTDNKPQGGPDGEQASGAEGNAWSEVPNYA